MIGHASAQLRDERAWPAWLPILPIALGVVLLAALARHPEPPTHFVGDAGVKVHLMDGWAGGGPFDNRLRFRDAPPFAQPIWQRFHAPFEAPFVRDGQVVFQALFPMLSLPGYRLLGYPGLFVLPVLSTIGLWLSLWASLRRAHLSSGPIALALLGLVLSATTFFGMTFWEHVPALFCLVIALQMVGPTGERVAASPGRARTLIAGVALALGCGLRPELSLAALPFVAWLARMRRLQAAFVVGAALGVAVVGSVNAWTTGTPLGLQSPEVLYLEQGAPTARLLAYYRGALVHLVLGGPFALGALAAGGIVVWRDGRAASATVALPLAMAASAWLLIPFIVPYNGEYLGFRRFELVVLPLAALVAAFLVQRSRALAVMLGVLAVLQAGAFVRFEERFAWGYGGRIRPLARAIEARAPEALLSNSQYPFQELAGLLPERPMFWAADARELAAVCEAVARHVDLEDTLFVWLDPPRRAELELPVGGARYRLRRERLPGEGSRPAFGLFRFERAP